MKILCGLIFILIFFVIVSDTAECSENYAGDFLSLGAGARALGMGNSYVIIADDATSSYHNPSGLARLQTKQINLMHSEQFAGLINYNTISFATPLSSDLFIGITLLHSGIGNIKYTRLIDKSKPLSEENRPEIASVEDATDYALYLSSARKFSEKLNIGASVKIIRRSIGPDTAFGYGIDLGMQYSLSSNWGIGMSLSDATGTTIAWDGKANDRIAATFDAGLSYTGIMPWVGGNYILTGSMLFLGDSPELKGLNTMNIGGEYRVGDFLAFRAGSSNGTGTFGLGIMRLPLISSSSFDYAFLSDDGLDSTHRISMTISF
ncbi:PorV/PorQ family protein [Candidatus Latescibacterota bacterium]